WLTVFQTGSPMAWAVEWAVAASTWRLRRSSALLVRWRTVSPGSGVIVSVPRSMAMPDRPGWLPGLAGPGVSRTILIISTRAGLGPATWSGSARTPVVARYH